MCFTSRGHSGDTNINITQTLLSNPSFVLDAQDGEYTANQLIGIHCRDWAKKPSDRRMRAVVAIAREIRTQAQINEACENAYTIANMPEIKTGCFDNKEIKVFLPEYVPYIDTLNEITSKCGKLPVVKRQEALEPRNARDFASPKFSIPESTQPVADDFLKLSGDFAIISDLHVPYHSAKTIEKFLETAYSQNVRKFIINGDMNDCGQFHPKRGDFQHHNHRYQDDLDLNKVIYAEFMKCFPEGGYVLSGNHDNWFVQNMKGELDADWTYSKFFHEFPLIKFSNFEQCQVTSANKVFRVLHGANYSATNPLSVVQKLSAKFECGVIAGHQHLSCSGHSYSGKYQTVCLGGAYELNRLSYLHHSPRCNPTPTNGFAILKDGIVTNYDNQEWFK